mgnify:CR=1 FL=1
MLRVLGVMLAVAGASTLMLLLLLSQTGYSAYIAALGSYAAPSPLRVKLLDNTTALIVAASPPVVLERAEGYRYFVRGYVDFILNSVANVTGRAFILPKAKFDTKVAPLIAAGVTTEQLLRALESEAIDSRSLNFTRYGGATFGDLDTGSAREVVVVVVARANITSGAMTGGNWTVVVGLGPTQRVASVPTAFVDVHVVARLEPTLNQYLRCLDLVAQGAVLTALDKVARRLRRKREKRGT